MRRKKSGNPPGGESTPLKHRRTEGLRRPWKEGESGNPAGRPKGSRNKFTEEFWSDFFGAWQEHGAAALEKIAKNEPGLFVRCAASLMPREMKLENEYANMTNEQIEQRIKELNRAIAAELGNAAVSEGDGKAEPSPLGTKH